MFNWWVTDALQDWDQIISRMEQRGVYAAVMVQGGSNNKYCHTIHKFGIKVPKTVEDALEIDY